MAQESTDTVALLAWTYQRQRADVMTVGRQPKPECSTS